MERRLAAPQLVRLAQQRVLQASLVCWVKQPLALVVLALLRAQLLVLAPWLATKLCNGAEDHSKLTISHLRLTTRTSSRLIRSRARLAKVMYGASPETRGRISGNKTRSRTSGAEVTRVGKAAMVVMAVVTAIGVIGSE